MHELAEQLFSHLKAIWRRRWYAIAVAWIIALVGWGVVFSIPNRYQADARVYVDTQTVLKPLLDGLAVQPDLDQMVAMISRTMLSRPGLEKVVEMAGLDKDVKTDEDRSRLLARLSNEIIFRSAGRENLYTISYVHQDPVVAHRIVQSLMTLFVEGSRGGHRNDSETARHFIDQQLEVNRQKLEAAETAVMKFKRQNLGVMSGQAGYYVRLDDAKGALKQAILELKEAENARDSIMKRFAVEQEQAASRTEETEVAAARESDIEQRIRTLGEKLDELRMSYTEQHPDIVNTVRMIEQLKEQKEQEARHSERQAQAAAPSSSAAPKRSAAYDQLVVSLTAAEARVASMRTRVTEFNSRYAELQAVANSVPQVEAEYTQLTRDYEVTRTRYEELLKRRAAAELSGVVEESDVAMIFRVVDPPQIPVLPAGPKRGLMMTFVLVLALGGGIGVAFALGQINPTITNETRLREFSGLPVLGTVVMAVSDAESTKRRRGLIALVLSTASLFSAYAAIMVAIALTGSRV